VRRRITEKTENAEGDGKGSDRINIDKKTGTPNPE
jgi:hypothetical protein